jgi:nicotinamide-nucleotide amidase
MTAEIVSVGTEILLGDIVDTNAAALGKAFARAGISHVRRQTVGDNLERLATALREALERSDLVVTIGGLGPTEDDLTRDGIAAALESPILEDGEVLEHLKERVRKRNYPWVESMGRQAMRPECAEIIVNDFGSAPGLLCRKNGKAIIALPGPRGEFLGMLDGPVASILQELGGGKQTIVSKTLRIVGLGESMVEERVKFLLDGGNPTVAPYAKTYEVHLRITASAADEKEARKLIAPVERSIRLELGDHIYGEDEESLPEVVVRLLKERGETIAAGESCTGGMVCGSLTDVTGASGVLKGGVVAYVADAKVAHLGVSTETILEHTVYSPEVAIEMAMGARDRFGATWGLGVTGVAGPEPDGNTKPGRVWIALAGPEEVVHETFRFPGDRESVRHRSVTAALNLVRKAVLAKMAG